MKSTYHTAICEGIPLSVPNVTEDGDDYYISYNNYDIGIYGCDTTAIVVNNPTNFLILNGDHRDNLRGLSKKDACKYFHDNKDLHNKMSDPHENHVLKIPS